MSENDKLNKVAYKQGSIYEKRVDKFGNPTYNKTDLDCIGDIFDIIISNLNLTKEKSMEIKDIKAGYLVEFMSGDLALAVPNELDDIMFVYSDGYCISSARDYDSIYDIDENPEYNIVKVYSAIKGYQCLFPLSKDRRDLLWSREIKLNCEDCPHMKEYKRSL